MGLLRTKVSLILLRDCLNFPKTSKILNIQTNIADEYIEMVVDDSNIPERKKGESIPSALLIFETTATHWELLNKK